MKIDKKIIKELTDYLNEFDLNEIEYTDKDTKIKVSKFSSSNNYQNLPLDKTFQQKITSNVNDISETSSEKEITSPIIGTAYHAPEPGAKKFVEIGKKLKSNEDILKYKLFGDGIYQLLDPDVKTDEF